MILNTLDETHPVDLIHLTCDGTVPGVAENSQLEAIRSLKSQDMRLRLRLRMMLLRSYRGVHVTAVCWPGLSVNAVITGGQSGLSEERREGVNRRSQHCSDPL